MKYIVLLGDGMADFPRDDCDGRTPIAFAETPAMDQAATDGICGQYCPIPEGFPPGSDIGNLSVFGYNPAETFTGRAPLEAFNQGIALAPNQLAFRCNLVTLGEGLMQDFTAQHISTEEAAEIIASLNEAFVDQPVTLHTGVGYRHLAIYTAADEDVPTLAALQCTPPHDLTDKPYAPGLPQGAGHDPILALMDASVEILKQHPVNARRVAAGKLPATSIWLWGQGRAPALSTYQDRFGISGAVISAVDLVNGIGRAAGLEVVHVPGATGYLDTDYAGKVSAALDALDRHDFVYLHVEAPDETSHEGKTDLKLQAIEDFDGRVVAPILSAVRKRGDCRIMIGPDHITALSTKTHAGGPVPFVLWGPGVEADAATCYSEAEAEKSGLLFPNGYALIPAMIKEATISVASLRA